MAALRTENLTKRYGSLLAVDCLDLTVEEGEVFGFLGPNGAGKSTTIDMLLDFVRPSDGRASVLGLDPRTDSLAVRAQIGVLPEGYDLYGRLSARKHVAFAVEMNESREDPAAILNRVGLADDANRPVGGFSKGMRQRLALGMALVGDPDLLILDEPSSGLDPAGVQRLRELIREEAAQGTTVFFSSHVMQEVEAVCDRVAIMDEGRLVAVDAIDELREATDKEFTLVLSVDEVPDSHDLLDLDGVTGVEAEGSTLRVECSDASAKAKVISCIEATGANVTDVDIEETDLEDVFAAFTSTGTAREVGR